MEVLRVASVQFEHRPGDKAANLETVTRFVARAAAGGARMAVFPECCLTGYWHLRRLTRDELAALAEPVPDGPSTAALLRLAREQGVGVGAGFIEDGGDGRIYKCYVFAMPDGTWASHRKLHAFVNPHLTSGSAYTVFDTPWGWRAGILICYDNNIIENGRMNALLGADVLLAPHQAGGCRSLDPHVMGAIDRALWDNRHQDAGAIEAEFRGPKGREWFLRWLPSRAHDNGYFVVFSNGVGIDDDEVRTGNAMVIDPYGRILAETWRADDDMVIADLDPGLLERNTGRLWLRTRRPELYGPLAQRTGAEMDTRDSLADEKGQF